MKVNLSGKKSFGRQKFSIILSQRYFGQPMGPCPCGCQAMTFLIQRCTGNVAKHCAIFQWCCEQKKYVKIISAQCRRKLSIKKNINNMTEVYDPNCLEDVRNCGAQGEFKLVHVQPICVKGGVPHTLSIDQGLTSASAGKCLTRSFRGCNISPYFNL